MFLFNPGTRPPVVLIPPYAVFVGISSLKHYMYSDHGVSIIQFKSPRKFPKDKQDPSYCNRPGL